MEILLALWFEPRSALKLVLLLLWMEGAWSGGLCHSLVFLKLKYPASEARGDTKCVLWEGKIM